MVDRPEREGVGGVNHITGRENGLIGLSGSLGGDISIAAGGTIALKREGKGGAFGECKTYRMRGHFEISKKPAAAS